MENTIGTGGPIGAVTHTLLASVKKTHGKTNGFVRLVSCLAFCLIAAIVVTPSHANHSSPTLQITYDDSRHYSEGENVTIVVSTANGRPSPRTVHEVIILVRHNGANPNNANTATEFIGHRRAIDGNLDGRLRNNSAGLFTLSEGRSNITFTLASENDNQDEDSTTIDVYLITGDRSRDPDGLPQNGTRDAHYAVAPDRQKVSVTIADDDPAVGIRATNPDVPFFAGGELDLKIFSTARGSFRDGKPDDTIYLRYTDNDGRPITDLFPTSVVLRGDIDNSTLGFTRAKSNETFAVITKLTHAGGVNAEIITNSGPGSNSSLPFTSYRLASGSDASRVSLTLGEGSIFAVTADPPSQYYYEGRDRPSFTARVANDVPLPADIEMQVVITQSGGDIVDSVTLYDSDGVPIGPPTAPFITNSQNFSFILPRGSRNFTARINPQNDLVDEDSATITMTLLPTDRYGVVRGQESASITIHDNDPELRIAPIDSVGEVVSGFPASFLITLDDPSASSFTRDHTIYLDFEATPGILNTTPPSNITIAAGQTNATITLATNSPAIPISRAQINATIITHTDASQPPTPYFPATGVETATINVIPFPLQPLAVTVLAPIFDRGGGLRENIGREGDLMQFRVAPQFASRFGRDIALNLRLSQEGGNMFVTDASFNASQGSPTNFIVPNRNFHRDFTVNLPHHAEEVIINVPSHNDELDEISGRVRLAIQRANPTGYIGSGASATITLLDDDPLYDITANTTQAFTGENITLTFTPNSPVQVLNRNLYYNITDSNGTLSQPRPTSNNIHSIHRDNSRGRGATTTTLTIDPDLGGKTGAVVARLHSDIDSFNASTAYRTTNTTLNISVFPTPPEVSLAVSPGTPLRIFEGRRLLGYDLNINPDRPILRDTSVSVRITQPALMIRSFSYGPSDSPTANQIDWREEFRLSQRFSVPIPANTTAYRLVVVTDNDLRDDAVGNITLEILPPETPTDYIVTAGSATASILVIDDDPEIALTTPPQVSGGENLSVTLTADTPLVADNIVQLAYSPDASNFILGEVPTNFTMPAGTQTASFNLPINPASARGDFTITLTAHDTLADPLTPYRVSPSQNTSTIFVQQPPELILEFSDGNEGNTRIYSEGGRPIAPRLRIRTADGLPFAGDLTLNLLVNQTGVTPAEKVQIGFIPQTPAIPFIPSLSTTNSADTLAVAVARGDNLVTISASNVPNDEVDSPVKTFAFEILPSPSAEYALPSAGSQRRASYRVVDDDPPIALRANQQSIRQGETLNFTALTDDGSRLLVNNRLRVRFSTSTPSTPITSIINGSSVARQVDMAAGSTSTDFLVATNADGLGDNEIALITADIVENPGAAPITPYKRALGGRASSQVIIAGSAAPAISIADVQASETSPTLSFPLTLTNTGGVGVNETLAVEYIVVAGTAEAGTNGDYILPYNASIGTGVGRVVLAAGTTTTSINITITDDNELELDETLQVRLLSITPNHLAVVGRAEATGTIIDNEPPPVLSLADIAVNEGAGPAVFNVTMSIPHVRPVMFDFATSGGLAEAGRATPQSQANATHPPDFSDTTGRAVIPAGATSYAIEVPLLDDTADEANQTFTLTISNPANATLSPTASTATATIIDNDPTARLTITTQQNGSEATTPTPIVFALTPDRLSEFAINASVAITPATASHPADYATTNVTFTSQRGISPTNPITFQVPVVDDLLDEADETLTARITTSTNAISDPAQQATAYIIDNDAPPALLIIGLGLDPNDIREREIGRFAINLNAVSGKPIRFDYATHAGTATPDVDYTSLNGTAVIPPGDTNFNLTIEALRDTESFEEDETLSIVLTNIINATPFGPPVFNVTILNAPLPTLTIADNSTEEGRQLIFHPRINFAWDEEMVVEYRLEAGTATLGEEFKITPGPTTAIPPYCEARTRICRLVIPANTTQRQLDPIPIPTTTDIVDEADETFHLVILRATNILVAGNATATIIDNDPPAEVGVTTLARGDVVNEGDEAVFTIALNTISGKNISVAYETQNDTTTATAGEDYTETRGNITITAGARRGEVRVAVLDDRLDEVSENFTLRLTSADNATIASTSSEAVVAIADNDDPPSISLSPPASPVREGQEANFTLTLSAPSAKNISVEYATRDGSATAGDGSGSASDYTATNGTLVITAGATTAQVSVPTLIDTLDEADETFALAITRADNATIPTTPSDAGEAEAIITDTNTPPHLTLTAPTDPVREGNPARFTISLDTPSGKNISVEYATEDGSATSPSDYNATSGTLFIRAGEMRGVVEVMTLGDLLDEDEEMFGLRLTNAVNATISNATSSNASFTRADATIADINNPPLVSVSPPADSINETGGGEAVFTLTLATPSAKNISVEYATQDGTAIAGLAGDYTAITAGTLIIPAGETTGEVRVAVLDDLLDEADEEFTLRLTSADNATLASNASDNTATAIIADDDAAPTLTLSAPRDPVPEGRPAVFTLTLSGASGKNISVAYATQDNTATATAIAGEGDYNATSGTLIIPVGATSGEVRVATLDDPLDEDTETFTLRITTPNNATIATPGNTTSPPASITATASISDNDLPPSVSIIASNSPVAEGDTAGFTIRLTSPSGKNISVAYTTNATASNATETDDYTPTSDIVAITAGATSAQVQVMTADDDLDEGDESLVVTIHSPNNATLADAGADARASATTIISDVPIGRVRMGEAAIQVDENVAGGMAVVPISLLPPQNASVTLQATTSDGTATAGGDGDYIALTNHPVIFEAGDSLYNLTIVLNNDDLDEGEETLRVQLGGLEAGSTRTQLDTSASGTMVTIIDDDDPPRVSVVSPTSPVDEGGEAVFTIRLDTASGKNISVDYATDATRGNATAGVDYATTAGTLIITAGATTAQVAVPVLDDELDEADETFVLRLTNTDNATIATDAGDTATATIADTDDPPSISISPPPTPTNEGGVALFTLTLNASSAKNISVEYTTQDGTARAGVGGDYATTTGTIILTAGTTSAQIQVPVLDDPLDEADETFALTLTRGDNVTLAGTQALATIADTDDPPSVSVSPPPTATNEGEVALFTITLNATSGKNISVAYMTQDGTAGVNSDYDLTFGVAVIRAGARSAQVPVPILNDDLDEAEEDFALRLMTPNNATIASGAGVATAVIISTDDPPSITITTNATSATPTQEGTGAWFVFTLNRESGKNISVAYATRDGSATAGEGDYTADAGAVVIPAGETRARIWVAVLDDLLDEADEDFTLLLTNPSNATLAVASVTASIADTDDPPSITLTGPTGATNEGDMALFTITINATSGKNISVEYATQDNTATAGAGDYAVTSGTLIIPVGETSGEVRVPILRDTLDEDDEEFVLRLTNPMNATIATGNETARATIEDANDPPVVSIAAPALPTAEGEMAVFTISLSTPSAKSISVDYATDPSRGNATSGTDYTETRGTLVITAGATQGEVSVPIADDTLDEGDEDFIMVLSNPLNATLAGLGGVGAGAEARASITDIPIGRIRLAASVINVTEGETAVVTLTLMPPQNDTVSVRATTADGGAEAGSDYTEINNRLIRFGVGATQQTIEIATRDDAVDEVAEDLLLQLTDLQAGRTRTRLVDSQVRVVIADNDKPSYTLTPDLDSIIEGGRVNVTLTLTTPWEEANPLTLLLTTEADATGGNPATSGADFVAIAGQPITIQQGGQSTSFAIETLADDVYEGNENFIMTLTDTPRATANASPLTRTITIIDDEVTPSLAFIGNSTRVIEGNGTAVTEVRLPLRLTGAVDNPLVVTLAVLVGTATEGDDYTQPPPSFTIPRNTTRAEIAVAVRGDDVDEFDESFAFGLATASHAIINATANQFTTIIVDDDPLPIITSQPANATEGNAVRFPITLSAPSAKLVEVAYATGIDALAPHPATAGADFTPQSGVVTFAPGETETHIEVATILDLDIEDNETFTLTLTNPSNAVLGGGGSESVAGLIIDAGVPLLSVANATATEGEALEFALQLSHPWIAPVVVEYETADGTAVAGEDYVAQQGRVTIPTGVREVVLPVATIGDDLDEVANETMRLLLSGADNAIITGNATGVIADDDGLPMMVLEAANVIEGRNASFVIAARGSRPIVDVIVPLVISPSGSINASDSGVRNVTFGARGRRAEVVLMTLDNNATGANEDIRGTLLAGEGYVLGDPASVMIRVLDDESISDIGDVANEAVLAQLITYMTERTTDVIGGRILGVLRFNSDSLGTLGGAGIPYGGREFVVDGQTLVGLAAREARREAAEKPWYSPTHPARLQESHDIYDLKFALPFAGLFADRFSMWGEGQYAEVSGSDDTAGVAYEGEIPGFVLGIDTRVSDSTIIGFSISQVNSDFTIRTSNATANTTNTTTARHRSAITTLHPYVGWLIGDALRVWLAAGFGEGDIRITSPDIDFDVETSVGLRLYSFGFDRALSSRGAVDAGGEITTYATGDIAVAELSVDAASDEDGWQSLQAQTLTTTTSRLAYTVRRMRQMATGIVTQEAEAIFRYDRGEAIEGAGLEIGGRLALSLNSGLHFNLRGRALLAHTGAAETDWGVSGGIRYSAQRGVGLSFAFVPEWGNPESGREAIWEAGLVSLAEGAGGGRGLKYRLDVRYGIPLTGFAFGGGQNYNGVLTPFVIRHANHDINLGADFTWGKHFSAGYELLLPEAESEGREDSLSINYDRKF